MYTVSDRLLCCICYRYTDSNVIENIDELSRWIDVNVSINWLGDSYNGYACTQCLKMIEKFVNRYINLLTDRSSNDDFFWRNFFLPTYFKFRIFSGGGGSNLEMTLECSWLQSSIKLLLNKITLVNENNHFSALKRISAAIKRIKLWISELPRYQIMCSFSTFSLSMGLESINQHYDIGWYS